MFIRKLFLWVFVCTWLTGCAALPLATPTPEPLTLRFSYWGRNADYEPIAKAFHNQYPYITIDLRPYSYHVQGAGAYNSFLEEFTKADVIRANAFFLSPDQLTQIRALDEFMTAEPAFENEDVYPGLLDALRLDGKQAALPAGIDPVLVIYEGLRLKIAGAQPPGVDYTLDDLIAAAAAVNNQDQKAQDEGKFAYGLCTAPQYGDAFTFTLMFGGRFFDIPGKPTRFTLNDPVNVEAVKWYAKLWNEDPVVSPNTHDSNQLYNDISANTCGYWLMPYDLLGIFDKNVREKHMLPLPKVKDPFSYSIWDAYFLTKASTNTSAAWLWMTYLVQHQEAALWQIPPLLSQIDSKEFAQRVSPEEAGIARELPRKNTLFYYLSEINAPVENQALNLFTQAVQNVIDGKQDVQSALDEAQAQAEKLLAGSGQ